MLNNTVDNLEQCEQQNIVQSCFHQARTGCSFFAVHADNAITFQCLSSTTLSSVMRTCSPDIASKFFPQPKFYTTEGFDEVT